MTEFVSAEVSNGHSTRPAATSTAASNAHSQNNSINTAPRRDLGPRPVTFTCPFCSHAGPTRTRSDCGDCTWISVIIMLLVCFPFFWVPFVCNNVSTK